MSVELNAASPIPTDNVVDPDYCKVEGLLDYVIMDRLVKFKIVLQDCFGLRSTNITAPLVVKVSELSVDLTDNLNGTYTASFLPVEDGNLSVSVSIAEQPIKGSPFPVYCRDYKEILMPFQVLHADGYIYSRPNGIAASRNGMLALSDADYVYVIDQNEAVINRLKWPIELYECHTFPAGLTFSSTNNLFVVMVDYEKCVVWKGAVDGKELENFHCPVLQRHPEKQRYLPSIATHKDKVYVTDPSNGRVLVVRDNGRFYLTIQTECGCLAGLTFSSLDHLLISDSHKNCIFIYSIEGKLLSTFGMGKFGPLFAPEGITTDAYGFILVCDTGNDRISVFDDKYTFVHCFGYTGIDDGAFVSPFALAVSSNGTIYIADHRHQRRIQKF